MDKHYKEPAKWEGRIDEDPSGQSVRLHELVKRLNLTALSSAASAQDLSLAEAGGSPDQKSQKIAFLGFASDEGVKRNQGRAGAKEGPVAIRKTLAGLPVNFGDSHYSFYDFGDISCDDGDLESAQAALGEAVKLLLDNKFLPIVLGGGHEIAYGHFEGIASHLEVNKKIGIINFDAHFDLRPLVDGRGSSGTPFLQIANLLKERDQDFSYMCLGVQEMSNTKGLFNTADELGVEYFLAKQIHNQLILDCEMDEPEDQSEEDILDKLESFLEDNDHIYLTLCLDVFDAAFAPGVSAPAASGLLPQVFMPLLAKIASSGKIISFDIAEMSPKFDIDNRTAKLAAAAIYEFLSSLEIK